jgi:hypothetical protein
VKHLVQWTVALGLAALTLQWAVSVVRASAVVLAVSVGCFAALQAWLGRRNRW